MARRRRRGRRRGSPGLLFVLFAAVVAAAFLYPVTQRSSAPRQAAPRVLPRTPAAQTAAPSAAAAQTTPPLASATPQPQRIVAPPAATPGSFRLAVIIDDCGQWPQIERALVALPAALTFSVMPKERYTRAIAQEAHAAGKDVMLHLPMEPLSGADPGRGKVTGTMSDDEIAAQVEQDVHAVPFADGANNHEGSKGSADPRLMAAVARELAPMGLFFIDSRTSAQSIARDEAMKAGLRTASRDVFLDNVDEQSAVEAQLREAAADARRSGAAIAIGHPRSATLAALRALLPELEREGVTVVPARDLVR